MSFSEEVVRMCLVDMLNCIHHLHSNRWFHLDLKAENVLIGEDGYFKVADFGTARIITDKEEELGR